MQAVFQFYASFLLVKRITGRKCLIRSLASPPKILADFDDILYWVPTTKVVEII